MFTRNLIILLTVSLLGCAQNNNDQNLKPSETESSQNSPNAKANNTETKMIKKGRVTLLSHKVEAGNPNLPAIEKGLESVTTTMNELLNDEKLKPAAGKFVGRLRLESNGTVRMLLTDSTSEVKNIKQDDLTNALVGAMFGGKCSFPELGDIAMLYTEFEIAPPE